MLLMNIEIPMIPIVFLLNRAEHEIYHANTYLNTKSFGTPGPGFGIEMLLPY